MSVKFVFNAAMAKRKRLIEAPLYSRKSTATDSVHVRICVYLHVRVYVHRLCEQMTRYFVEIEDQIHLF